MPPIRAMGLIELPPIEKPSKNTPYMRAIMNTPATTMVAAWMSAETGVGPAMASGSQVCRRNWPDFDMTAAIRQQDATSSAVCESWPAPARALVSAIENEPNWPGSAEPTVKNRIVTPTMRPMSPTRLVRNALSAASLLGFSSHQWPINTKEQTPTSSHETSSCSVFSDTTSNSIEALNRERKAKKCV